MSSRTHIIANPAARSGRLGQEIDGIRSALEAELGPVVLHTTTAAREAEVLARTLPGGTERVIAIGGDGTLNEVVCGLTDRADRIPMGIVPFGSGNDLARALFLPGSVRDAIGLLSRARPVPIDTGSVQWTDGNGTGSRRFVNAVGIGLDAWSAAFAPRYKGWPLGVGYSVAVLQALRSWVSAGASVRGWVGDGEEGEVLHNGPLMFITVGNAQDSGGGYKLNPHARLRDGLVDACIVEGITRLRALTMLPTARTGAHLRAREVSYRQVRRLGVETDRGLPIHTDGEVVTLEGRRIGVDVHPLSLDVLINPADADRI